MRTKAYFTLTLTATTLDGETVTLPLVTPGDTLDGSDLSLDISLSTQTTPTLNGYAYQSANANATLTLNITTTADYATPEEVQSAMLATTNLYSNITTATASLISHTTKTSAHYNATINSVNQQITYAKNRLTTAYNLTLTPTH
jgi:hypothetical protein